MRIMKFAVKNFACLMIMFAVLALSGVAVFAQSGWDHFEKAGKLQEQGDVNGAISELQTAIKMEPANAFYQNALGLAYLDIGDFNNALESLQKAVELNDNLPEAYSGIGVCMNAKGNYRASIEAFTKALQLTPDTSPDKAVIHNNLGQNYYLLKDYDRAEEELMKAVALNDSLLTAYINLGNVYTERGDFDNAIAYHKKAVELAPQYALPRNNLAFSYAQLGMYDEAVVEMQKAVELSPTNEQFKKNYEMLLQQQAKYVDATFKEGPLAGLPKEITLKPRDGQPAPQPETQPATNEPQVADEPELVPVEPLTPTEEVELEVVLAPEESTPSVDRQHSSTPEEATVTQTPPEEIILDEPIPLDEPEAVPYTTVNPEPTPEPQPTSQPVVQPAPEPTPTPAPSVASSPGKPYERIERQHTALYPSERKTQFERKDFRSQPEQAAEFYRAAKYNLKIGNNEAALNDIRRALEMFPDNMNFNLVHAMIRERLGFVHEATAVYENILEQIPDHSTALNNMGHVQDVLGNDKVAMEYYQKAYQADSENGCAAANIGTVLVNEGRCDEAMEYLMQASRAQCLKAPVLNNMSLCYFGDGDYDNAQNQSYRALEKEPFNDTILSNFSFILAKSGDNYKPIKVSEDSRLDPFYKLSEFEKETPLTSLTPVDTLDFYDVFRNNYNRKSIVIVPFENPRGTHHWKPTPSETHTRKLANELRESGYFNVIVADNMDYSAISYSEKISKDFIQDVLRRNPADVVYLGNISTPVVENEVNTRYKGLKKKDYVETTLPVETKLVQVGDELPIIETEMLGNGYTDGVKTNLLKYNDVRRMKDDAFEDYCAQINDLLMDHFHLVEYPVQQNVVKFVKSMPTKQVDYRR